MFILPVAFFVTALLYAAVGFGGGSTYNALLVLHEVDFRAIPFLSLLCNIIVVSGGAWHFYRERHLEIIKIVPWVVFSVPASFIGGLIPVPEQVFTGVLGMALAFSGIRLLWPDKVKGDIKADNALTKIELKYLPPVLGVLLGLTAGITGIGGGIFLAPLLHFLRWGHAKQIAGACAIFILVNSLGGLAGQVIKTGLAGIPGLVSSYWLLFPAVLAGGQIGSWLGASRIDTELVKKATGILILYVAGKLLIKFMETMS